MEITVRDSGTGISPDALAELKCDRHFDLLFTDVVLPGGMNGLEIAVAAKRLQPDIKVLYTSGYAEDAVIHDGELEAGVSLIHKPYRRAELLDRIRAIIDDCA